MKTWQRRVLALTTLLGGWMGLLTTISWWLDGGEFLAVFICLLFAATFAWGMWLGVRLLEAYRGALAPLSIFWFLQVPMFDSSAFSYAMECGMSVFITLQFPFKFAAEASFGTNFTFLLDSPDRNLKIGANVFALALALWLRRLARST